MHRATNNATRRMYYRRVGSVLRTPGEQDCDQHCDERAASGSET
ncbi:hypothetical protein [Nocardia ninae]|nr:hypothetical protein [Nocardia ninae]